MTHVFERRRNLLKAVQTIFLFCCLMPLWKWAGFQSLRFPAWARFVAGRALEGPGGEREAGQRLPRAGMCLSGEDVLGLPPGVDERT